jgi:molecular chaperone GrpE (heat shock protein)
MSDLSKEISKLKERRYLTDKDKIIQKQAERIAELEKALRSQTNRVKLLEPLLSDNEQLRIKKLEKIISDLLTISDVAMSYKSISTQKQKAWHDLQVIKKALKGGVE